MHPYSPLSYNYVAPAVRADGTEVVLKLGIPSNEFRTEIEALRFFDGHGAARLLDSDSELGCGLEACRRACPKPRLHLEGERLSGRVPGAKAQWHGRRRAAGPSNDR